MLSMSCLFQPHGTVTAIHKYELEITDEGMEGSKSFHFTSLFDKLCSSHHFGGRVFHV